MFGRRRSALLSWWMYSLCFCCLLLPCLACHPYPSLPPSSANPKSPRSGFPIMAPLTAAPTQIWPPIFPCDTFTTAPHPKCIIFTSPTIFHQIPKPPDPLFSTFFHKSLSCPRVPSILPRGLFSSTYPNPLYFLFFLFKPIAPPDPTTNPYHVCLFTLFSYCFQKRPPPWLIELADKQNGSEVGPDFMEEQVGVEAHPTG